MSSSTSPNHAGPTTPALYESVVGHVRTAPVHNAFTHRTYYWLVDLDHLPRLPLLLRPLAGFRTADHGDGDASTLRAGVDTFLAEHGITLGEEPRVLMLCQARVLGYVFNPLTVYWCRDRTGLRAVVAEVHNTYGDRHRYLVHTDDRGRATVDKALYVSPFNRVEGHYRLTLPEPGPRLSLTVALHRHGHPPFTATVRGTRRKATPGALLRAALRHPLAPLVAAARIRLQGIGLYLRGLPVQPDRNKAPTPTGTPR
ncbi:DUF1365 domain-containing protein [Nocardiopsis coralli]|uniref:DUF1365 domain-containing protein n=1 Tax=Nocardiopsis coralli TaxID=2772213 RepID=UPI002E2E7A2B|nr:DUF1365 domain-containing protein [Nocardiopsis coralli]